MGKLLFSLYDLMFIVNCNWCSGGYRNCLLMVQFVIKFVVQREKGFQRGSRMGLIYVYVKMRRLDSGKQEM